MFVDNGAINENKFDSGAGRLNRMLIPKLRNGFERSITFDRTKFTVNEANAISALFL